MIKVLMILAPFLAFSHTATQIFNLQPEFTTTLKFKNWHFEMARARALGVDILGVDYPEKLVDIAATEEQLQLLESYGYQINNYHSKYVLDKRLDENFKNPDEITQILDQVAADYPSIVKKFSIGKSVEGRDIWAVKISDNVGVDESEESAILFNAAHHSREIITPEVPLDIIEQLTTQYGVNAKLTSYVNNYETYVVPMLNVDGSAKVWAGSSMWRKNVGGRRGVDLNRNYPYQWGACNGSSGRSWSDTYRGPSAGSEPETQALMNLVASIRPVFDISYHSYSNLVIYPYGCEGERAETEEVLASIGNEIGSLLGYTAGYAWDLLYSVDGGDIDWMYNEYQVNSYVLELTPRSTGFHPDWEIRDQVVENNRQGWMLLFEKMDSSGIRGNINTTVNYQGEYTVDVIKNGEVFVTHKINPNGTFHIILNPGSYILNFKENNAQVHSEKVIVGSRRSDLDIQF